MVEQFEYCGVNEFLISLDGAANNIPATVAGFNVIATQVITGWNTEDTSIYYALANIKKTAHLHDKTELGKGLGLLVSQILKFEAPAAKVEVVPAGV